MAQHSRNGITEKELFDYNRKWASDITAHDPEYFKKLAAQQTPEYLWIGCSDSRVPANELLGMMSGELFVHRNVANLVVHTDLNCLSVLQFAIDVLRVKHIIVCGHYGCSGVGAVISKRRLGLADNWLRHVQDVSIKHERYLGEVVAPGEKLDRLCELNVIEQVANLCQTTIVEDAWERGQSLLIHGWIYGLQDGLLRDLGVNVTGPGQIGAKLEQTFKRYQAA